MEIEFVNLSLYKESVSVISFPILSAFLFKEESLYSFESY